MKHEMISSHHLERKAILYMRQSTAHQVLHNRESGALQYAMRDWLATLGWSCIETIDDDLGRSAAGGVARAGFDRMVAEVCLGKVGAVAARDVSRFARNSRDWQQLIEMTRLGSHPSSRCNVPDGLKALSGDFRCDAENGVELLLVDPGEGPDHPVAACRLPLVILFEENRADRTHD